jgi:hypothetical protein
MSKHITLAQLADKLGWEARLIDYCRVDSIESNEEEFVFHLNFLDGRVDEFRIKKQITQQ